MDMRKKLMAGLACCLLLTALLPLPARADIGPKPRVTVTFSGISGEKAYATLLSPKSPWGPYQAWDGYSRNERLTEEEREIWQEFARYEDPDGFCFLQEYWYCTDAQSFTWSYYPPNTFKLLLYFPETGAFLSSGVLERYAFESYFHCAVSGGEMQVRASYDYARGLSRAALRAALTILLEVGLALLFGYREKGQLLLFALTNLATQALQYISLYLITYWQGPWAFWFWFAVLELAVFLVEAVAYSLLIGRCGRTRQSPARARWYALLANLLSCGLGLALSRLTPEIF